MPSRPRSKRCIGIRRLSSSGAEKSGCLLPATDRLRVFICSVCIRLVNYGNFVDSTLSIQWGVFGAWGILLVFFAQLWTRVLIDPTALARQLEIRSNRIDYFRLVFFDALLVLISMLAVGFKTSRESLILTGIGLDGYILFTIAVLARAFLVLFLEVKPSVLELDAMQPGTGTSKMLYIGLTLGFFVGNLFFGLAMRASSAPGHRSGAGLLVSCLAGGRAHLFVDHDCLGPDSVAGILRYALSGIQLFVRCATGIWLWRFSRPAPT